MAQKIYTKVGDKGITSLFGGKKLPKSHLRIECYGTVDELNSFIGVFSDGISDADLKSKLKFIQDQLFTLGSNLACEPGKNLGISPIRNEDVEFLENQIDTMEAMLPPLKNFILPGGHFVVSMCHVARCVCRRAERRLVALNMDEPVDEVYLIYLNRLSDYLFVLSRKLGKDLGAEEIAWKPRG